MKASINALVAILTITSLGLVATSASACGGSKGGNGSGFYGGYNNYHVIVKKVYVEPVAVAPPISPLHSLVFVSPGDSWFTICIREYNDARLWTKVAQFNGLAEGTPLSPGMQLRLPVIFSTGEMVASSAPPAMPVAGPATLPQPVMPQLPETNADTTTNAAPVEEKLPNVMTGASFTLAGRDIGAERGSLRLKINGLVLPIDILDWTASSVKLQLPKLELELAAKAAIETVRADGTIAATTRINLVPAAASLASSN